MSLPQTPITKNKDLTVVNLFAGPGAGKCLEKDTPVLMYNGSIKPVQEIKTGDLLMGPDSSPRTVLSLCSGIDIIYKIIPVKGDPWGCNSNHIMTLTASGTKGLRKHSEIKDIPLKNILDGKITGKRWKLLRTGVEFPHQEIPCDPYFIGLWLGDGTLHEAAITNMDSEIINYIHEFASSLSLQVSTISKKNTKALRLTLVVNKGSRNSVMYSNHLRQYLRTTFQEKYIPSQYLINSRKNRLSLLAGLLDTDGHYYNGCYEISTVSKRLKNDILYLARSLGFAAYTKETIKTIKTIGFSGLYYRITIAGNVSEIPCKIKRKQASIRKQSKRTTAIGWVAQSNGIGEYYGFELDRDGRFLLGDFTITHNSTTAAGVFHEMKLKHWDVELVTEFPKDLVYQQRWNMFFEQADIFTEQHHRQRRLVQYGVKYCVTDSPLLLCHMYVSQDYYKNLLPLVDEAFNSFDNINIFLKRTKKYSPKGRNQTEEESLAIDRKTLDLLFDQKQKFYMVNGDHKAPKKILQIVDFLKNGGTIFNDDPSEDPITYVDASKVEKQFLVDLGIM